MKTKAELWNELLQSRYPWIAAIPPEKRDGYVCKMDMLKLEKGRDEAILYEAGLGCFAYRRIPLYRGIRGMAIGRLL